MTVISRLCARCSRPLSRYNNGDYCGSCEASDDRIENDRISPEAAIEIGQRLKAVRQRRGMSLRVVAGLAGVSAAYLSMVETGKRSLDRYSLIRDLAQALRVPASDLAPGLSEGGAKPHSPRLAAAESGTRPSLVNEDESAIDDSDLLAMQGFRVADRQMGGGHLYFTVLRYLRTSVAPRLFGAAGVNNGQHIFTVASGLTEMAGWMAHDAGRDDSANQHFQRSLELAHAGGDHQLSAHVMASLSHLALHQGQPDKAIGLARKGRHVLSQGPANHALTAHLTALHARGLARRPHPDAAAVGKALLQAERALDKENLDRCSPWVSRFDEGSLASEATRSLRQLGQYDAAVRSAQRIIEVRPGSHMRSRTFGQLLLADALVAKGEIEHACSAGLEALAAVSSLSSYLVVEQARQLAKLLEPQRGNHIVGAYLAAVDDALSDQYWLSS